jgi:1-deoxy-D-xylulose-5-phosphate reductoisomerase
VANVAILGSTGSIGTQALEVCRHLGIGVTALSAGRNILLLEKQIREFAPQFAAVEDEGLAKELSTRLEGFPTRIGGGESALIEAAAYEGADAVLAATGGVAGLLPVYAAILEGKKVALANKEALVCAGSVLMQAAERFGARILPVDSEHSAIFQCLEAGREKARRIILTASGGPFWGMGAKEMEGADLLGALSHPTWNMGKKISVDSATMMNKGLEWIEARWLFPLPWESIEIVVHPQSVVHSAVEFEDGAVIAQLGAQDMRLPIQYALTYPDRLPSLSGRLDFAAPMALEFYPPDYKSFPCLALAKEALQAPGSLAAVMAASDEAAVEAFMEGKIGFLDIARCVERAMSRHAAFEPSSIETIAEICRESKAAAREIAAGIAKL